VIDVQASTDATYDYLTENFGGNACDIDLVVVVDEPKGNAEDLSKVKDVLGTFTTSYSTSGSSRSANVANGCSLINGTTLYPGEEFSAYETVSPFSEANGYYMAGSYLNGQVVDSLGGGICQVSTTLYNAVLRAELEVTERYNHSMIVTYVDPSADAAISESSGKDFKFVNNTDYPIYIEGKTSSDKHITFTIYGVETRPSTHEVEYVSEVLETNVPDTEVIYTNASLPVGYCSVQSAHIGYKARLWKVVKENGVEVSREQINSSSYMKSPRSATVGVATEDPAAYEAIMAAVATNSIDQVKAVAAGYQAAADAAAAQAAAEAAAQAAETPAAADGLAP
jgi:vancomycin resistance protein YoaR